MQIFQNESKFMGQISISKGFLMWKKAFPGRWVMWRSPASGEDRQRLKVGGAGGTPARMCNPVKNEWPGANSRLSWSNMLLISGSLLSLFPLETLWSPETGVVRNWAHLPKCQWDFPEEKAFRISLPGLLCAAHFIRTVGSEQRRPEFLSFWLSTLPLGSHYPLRGRHQNRHLTPWNGGREAALLVWTTSVEQQPCRSFSVFSLTRLRFFSDPGSSSLLQGLSDQVSLSFAAYLVIIPQGSQVWLHFTVLELQCAQWTESGQQEVHLITFRSSIQRKASYRKYWIYEGTAVSLRKLYSSCSQQSPSPSSSTNT